MRRDECVFVRTREGGRGRGGHTKPSGRLVQSIVARSLWGVYTLKCVFCEVYTIRSLYSATSILCEVYPMRWRAEVGDGAKANAIPRWLEAHSWNHPSSRNGSSSPNALLLSPAVKSTVLGPVSGVSFVRRCVERCLLVFRLFSCVFC